MLADVRQFWATRGRKWAVVAVGLFVLGAALNNILLTRVASLSLMTKLLLAAAVTVGLVAMARALQPQPADQSEQLAVRAEATPPR